MPKRKKSKSKTKVLTKRGSARTNRKTKTRASSYRGSPRYQHARNSFDEPRMEMTREEPCYGRLLSSLDVLDNKKKYVKVSLKSTTDLESEVRGKIISVT